MGNGLFLYLLNSFCRKLSTWSLPLMWNLNKVLRKRHGPPTGKMPDEARATSCTKHPLEQIPNQISAKLTKQTPDIGMIPHIPK